LSFFENRKAFTAFLFFFARLAQINVSPFAPIPVWLLRIVLFPETKVEKRQDCVGVIFKSDLSLYLPGPAVGEQTNNVAKKYQQTIDSDTLKLGC
jgi:hypothetical protein